jgi:hypothetical protein
MIGLLATYCIVAYLLVPSGLFRSVHSLFLPRIIKFQRTRVEEFTFAVLAAILPFFLALGMVWTVATWPFGVHGDSSSDRRDEYRAVIGAAISDKAAYLEGREVRSFWHSTSQVIRRQGRFLTWYYFLVMLEAGLCAWLTRNYGLWSDTLPAGWRRRAYTWTAEKVLLPAISEWYVLLTPFSYPPEPPREVWVDVLTTVDVLYKGHVLNFFLDKEGELSGIFLDYPRRFDRKGLLRDIEKGTAKADNDYYWRTIPSNNLYIPNDKIVNLNVRYLTEGEGTALRASWLLVDEGLDVAAGH